MRALHVGLWKGGVRWVLQDRASLPSDEDVLGTVLQVEPHNLLHGITHVVAVSLRRQPPRPSGTLQWWTLKFNFSLSYESVFSWTTAMNFPLLAKWKYQISVKERSSAVLIFYFLVAPLAAFKASKLDWDDWLLCQEIYLAHTIPFSICIEKQIPGNRCESCVFFSGVSCSTLAPLSFILLHNVAISNSSLCRWVALSSF